MTEGHETPEISRVPTDKTVCRDVDMHAAITDDRLSQIGNETGKGRKTS
jgi:hypothetical protein